MQVIIPGAGSNHSKILAFSENLPDALIPLNGKPVLDYILGELRYHRLDNIILVVNPEDVSRFSNQMKKYEKSLNIRITSVNDTGGGLLDTLAASEGLCESEDLFIVLSDTIFRTNLDFSRSTVYYKNTEDIYRWCLVEKGIDGRVERLIDKPRHYAGVPQALVGLYYFSDARLFYESLAKARAAGRRELSQVIEGMLSRGHDIYAKECDEWIDCGSVDNYYKAKRKLLQSGHFNSVKVDEFYNVISKSSRDKHKLHLEHEWYTQLPSRLQSFVPRIFSYSETDGGAVLELEYYGHPSLSEYYVYTPLPMDVWDSMLNHLFSIVKVFRSNRGVLHRQDFYNMYVEKTKDRIRMLRECPGWNEWLEKEELVINGKKCAGYPLLKDWIERMDYYRSDDVCIMHGDMCFTNILYDLNGHTVKFLDPRGSFGKEGIYGDVKYDLAKLRHSAHGCYDYLINDLFALKRTGDASYEYEMYPSAWGAEVSRKLDERITSLGYDLRDIQAIEGLLFLTMIPLHADKPARQELMGLRAIELLNEVYE